MKTLKPICVTLLFFIPFILFAQLPNFFDPFFDHETDILNPQQAKENHVKSCLVKINGVEDHYAIYDGNGRNKIVSKTFTTLYYIYNGQGQIVTGHIFNGNEYSGVYNIEYNSNGAFNSIETIYSQLIKTFDGPLKTYTKFEYENDKLTGYIKSGNLLDNFDEGDLFESAIIKYDDSGNCRSVSLEKTISNSQNNTEKKSNFRYKSNKLKSVVDEEFEYTYIYDDNDKPVKIDRITLVEMLYGWDASEDKTAVKFEYNEKGMVINKNDIPNEQIYTYEYEYNDPVNINIEGEVQEISMYNFSQNYDYNEFTSTDGKFNFTIYPGNKELYVLTIAQQFTLPIIVNPGIDINISITPDLIYYGEGDEENKLILEIESAKLEILSKDLTEEQTLVEFAAILSEKINAYPDFIGFLFYINFWDLENNNQLFLDYTSNLYNLHPSNFKVIEAYARIRQQ